MAPSRRTDRAERLLDLVSLFLAAKEPVTWAQLQEAFPADYGGPSSEASLRKWERDKAELVELGVPLTWVQGADDQPDGYVVAQAEYYLRDLALEPSELPRLTLARPAAQARPSFPFRTDLAHALDKLLFSADPRSRAPGDESPGFVVHLPAPGAEAKGEVLEKLGRAVASRKDVSFAYEAFSGERTERRVSPFGLAYRHGAWFFVGHCHLREGLRTFQVERVKELEVNAARPRHPDFEVPEGFSVRDHVSLEAWQYKVHPPVEVEVRLDGPVALLARSRFGASAALEVEADGGVRVKLRSTNGDAVVREVLALAPHAELGAPAALRRRVAEAAERLAAEHGP